MKNPLVQTVCFQLQQTVQFHFSSLKNIYKTLKILLSTLLTHDELAASCDDAHIQTVCSIFKKQSLKCFLFRDGSVSKCLWGSVQQLKHVVDNLPQTVLQRKVIVYQVDQEVVIVDVLDDHP